MLGPQNQSFPLAAKMHYSGSKRGHVNVGGMVSLCIDWYLPDFAVLRDGAGGGSRQIEEEALK